MLTASNSRVSMRGSPSRFAPNAFQYNGRVGLALVPCIVFLLGLGGKPVLATSTLGILISYILDSLHLKHGAFFGVWASLFATVGALLFSGTSLSTASTPLYVLALFVSFQLVFLVGVWASLQFKWLQLENPSVVWALERLLFACIPFTASTILAWALVVSVGVHRAPFYLMPVVFGLYWLFGLPQPSSFRTKLERQYGGQVSDEALISGSLEAAAHSLTVLFLPLLFHIAAHHRRLIASPNAICDLLLLFFVPLLFQLYSSTRGALWWLAKDPSDLRRLQNVNAVVSILVVIVCLEIRVIFHSFNQYIMVSAPWSYLLVTTALLGSAAAMGLSFSGLLSQSATPFPLACLFAAAAICGSLVVGMPFMFMPVPLVAAVFFSEFCIKKSIFSYFLFTVAASFSLGWFMMHNFWPLNIWLGGLKLKVICNLITASAVLALAVPGLVRLPRRAHPLVEVVLVGHALLVCQLENRLYNYGSIYHFGLEEDAVYPSYLVIATTLIGLVLTWKMTQETLLGSLATWVLTCLYLGKLSLLLLSTKDVLWPSTLFFLAISPPILLYKGKGKGLSKMKSWQGLGHVAVVFVTVWFCRHAVNECIHWWTGQPPSDALVLGCLILVSSLTSVPIVTSHFSHVQLAKKWLLLVTSFGLMLIFFQPPMRGALSSWWSSSRIVDMPDDGSMYGFESSNPSWPVWLLVWTLVLSLASLTSVLPVQHVVELRLVYAVVVGLNIGIYLCVQYFVQAVIIHGLLVAAVVSATLFLVFSHLPSATSPIYLPWVFLLFIFLLPVMYFAEGQLDIDPEQGDGSGRVVPSLAIKGARTGLLGLYAAILMLIALEVKLRLGVLRNKGLEKAAGRGLPSSSSGCRPKHPLQRRLRVVLEGSLSSGKLPSEGAWVPMIGNIATLLCFTICLVLNVHLTGGSDRAILLLAPILLLLNQDLDLLVGFGDKERYFPVTCAASIYLTSSAAFSLWHEAWHGNQNSVWGLEAGRPGMFFALKNAILLLLVIPNHAMFNRFMWDYGRVSDFMLLITAPLNLPAAVITDMSTIRLLAVLGMAYSGVQYLVSRQVQIAGQRFV